MANPTERDAESDSFFQHEKQHQELSGRSRVSKKKICILTCLACIFLVLLVVGVGAIYIFTRGNISEDPKIWEQILNSSVIPASEVVIDGTYVLKSFDDQYPQYLKAMGIPFFVVPLILSSSEKIEIVMPKTDEDKVIIRTITDWITRESEFKFNEEFSMQYGKDSMGGQMYNVCHQPKPNIINCNSEEREKNWRFSSELIFTGTGMVNKREFTTNNIVTKKFYQKEGFENTETHIEKIRKRDDKVTLPDFLQDEQEWLEDWSEEDDDGWLDDI